jgi:hypothetical protein
MDSIQRIAQPGSVTLRTDLNKQEISTYNVIVEVNNLTAFPMSGDQIEVWAKDLVRLIPGLDLGALAFLIDQMKLGNYDYDKNLGIQNLTQGLTFVRKTEEGYKIAKSNHW